MVATPNSYGAFLLCVAAAGQAPSPSPSTCRWRRRDRPRHRRLGGHPRGAGGRGARGGRGGGRLTSPAASDPGDVAAIFYTSGTTGKPKGARLTHRALVTQAQAAAVYPSGARRDEAVAGLPVAHIMGFVVLLSLAIGGVPVYFLPRFRPDDALDAIERRRATVFVGVPAMYRLMLEAEGPRSAIRRACVWASGADVMPPTWRAGSSRSVPPRRCQCSACPSGRAVRGGLRHGRSGRRRRRQGVAARPPVAARRFLGVPLPSYRLRVVGDDGRGGIGQVGELHVRGPGVLQGYHGDPGLRRGAHSRRLGGRATWSGGDPFGLVSFVGRSKDVIKKGSLGVRRGGAGGVGRHPPSPGQPPSGSPTIGWGEQVARRCGCCRGRRRRRPSWSSGAAAILSDYKVPAQVRIVDDLPRTGTDKVKKAELRSLFS